MSLLVSDGIGILKNFATWKICMDLQSNSYHVIGMEFQTKLLLVSVWISKKKSLMLYVSACNSKHELADVQTM